MGSDRLGSGSLAAILKPCNRLSRQSIGLAKAVLSHASQPERPLPSIRLQLGSRPVPNRPISAWETVDGL